MNKTLNSLLLTLSLTLLLPVVSTAQTFDQPMRINTDHSSSVAQGGPILRVGHDGAIHIAWVDFRDNTGGDIYLRVSEDGGDTFGPERVVYRGMSIPAGMGRGANMVVAPDGTIHVIWLEITGPQTTDVKAVRSTDGGQTFSAPILVVGDDGGAAQDFPSVAVDSSGAVTIAWVDGRDRKRGLDEFDQIYMTRSTDRGLTFTAPIQASSYAGGRGGSCECCNTSTAIGPDGDIMIAYRSNIDNVRDIYVARSRDDGATFEPAIRMPSESWNIFACPMAGPTIGIDREGTAHVLWKDNRSSAGGKQYMYYAALWNDATTPTLDRPVATSARQTNYPTIDFLSSGAMVVTFEDAGSTARALYYASGDGGNSFVVEDVTAPSMSPPNQKMPIVAVGPDGTRHLVWQDDRRGAGDIWYARDASAIATTLPAQVELLLPIDAGLMLAGQALSWREPANLASGANIRYTVTIGSSDPNVVPMGINTSDLRLIPDLPNGNYTWSVTAKTLIGSSEPSVTRSFTVGTIGGIAQESRTRTHVAPNPVGRDEDAVMIITRDESGSERLRVTLVDLLGREIALLFDGMAQSAELRLPIATEGLPSGAYAVVVDGERERLVERVIVAQ